MATIISRRQQREWAVQLLYLMGQTGYQLEQAWHYFLKLERGAERANYTQNLVKGVLEKIEELDGEIEKYLSSWRLERLSRVDLNIIRLGLYEMKYCPDVPDAVAVDEAIELGKAFGGEESGRFINGLLGQFFEKQD